jgi:hypothetical protein
LDALGRTHDIERMSGYVHAEETLVEPDNVSGDGRDRDAREGGMVEHLADGTGILIDPTGRTADELADEVLRWAREIGMDVSDPPTR